MKPTIYTWILTIFGAITFLPLMVTQFAMLLKPDSRKVKDLIIAKGEDWRDPTHFRSALAFAWADMLVILPLLVTSAVGVFSGQLWGYVLWLALGVLSIYFSIVFWVLEKKYAYPICGWLAYYTYIWGFFLYWGVGAVVYSLQVIIS
jgi:hypothetical protein